MYIFIYIMIFLKIWKKIKKEEQSGIRNKNNPTRKKINEIIANHLIATKEHRHT